MDKFDNCSKGPVKYEDITPKFSHMEVKVYDSSVESFNTALKIWKSMVQKSRILSDFKASKTYEKPSEKRKREKREGVERRRILAVKEKQMASGEWDKIQKKKERRRENKRQYEKEQREKNNREDSVRYE